jgi:hypothetical protein
MLRSTPYKSDGVFRLDALCCGDPQSKRGRMACQETTSLR